jgi:hypothetical protein
MGPSRTLRINEVGAYLGDSHQQAAQMYAEGKLPQPERVHRSAMEARQDRAVDREGVVGDAPLEKATQKLGHGHGARQHHHVESVLLRPGLGPEPGS